MSLYVLVPGSWTVNRGHGLLEQVEAEIRRTLSKVSVFTHLESLDDRASWEDVALDRADRQAAGTLPPHSSTNGR